MNATWIYTTQWRKQVKQKQHTMLETMWKFIKNSFNMRFKDGPKTRKWFVFLIFQLFHNGRIGPLVVTVRERESFVYQKAMQQCGTRRVENRRVERWKKFLFADLMLNYCHFSVTNRERAERRDWKSPPTTSSGKTISCRFASFWYL